MLRRNYNNIFIILTIVLMLLTAALGGCAATAPSQAPGPTAGGGQLKVHFLDVGQADSILVETPGGEIMLIDAGNNDDGKAVVSYLKRCGVKKIDYLVGTHPHEDHIGGLDNVINSFKIGSVYMPRVNHSTKTYTDVLGAVDNKGLKITSARAGVDIINSGELRAAILSPGSTSYEEMNDYSAVIKLSFKDVSFLFTGDAGEIPEEEMLKRNFDLKADVLKVGHHGSHSSTSPDFLGAVRPDYAVLSVGAGNDYGHPHRETMTTLGNRKDIKTYRTDLNGTTVFSTDGKSIEIKCEKPPV